MGQELLVLAADLRIGALHDERPSILSSRRLRKLEAVEHGHGAAGGGDGSVPFAGGCIDYPARVGRDDHGHGLSLCGRRHGVLAHLECNRSVSLGTLCLLQLKARSVYSARGHDCHDQCEQCKYFLFHIVFTLMLSFFSRLRREIIQIIQIFFIFNI